MIRMSGNRAFNGAIRKGWDAYHTGKDRLDHPYSDARTYRGGITFSRAFIRAWQDGWQEAKDGGPRP